MVRLKDGTTYLGYVAWDLTPLISCLRRLQYSR
jgi:hypothetical protein